MLEHALHKVSCTSTLDKATVAAFRKVFSKTYSKSTSRQCPVCNKEFVRAVLQHALKKTSCNQALDEATVTAFDEEISRKYSQPNSKQCPVCNKEFVNRQAMLEHALHKASCSSVLDKPMWWHSGRNFPKNAASLARRANLKLI